MHHRRDAIDATPSTVFHAGRGRNDQGANISPMVIMLCMKVWQAYQDSPVKPPVKRSVQDLPRRWRWWEK